MTGMMHRAESVAATVTDQKTYIQALSILSFAILTAIAAQVEIPNQPVPFTLQTFFVLTAGALLGKRNGFLSMSLYLALGAIGLPVFSGGMFGIARIIGPTGGYLLSFPLVAFAVGHLVRIRGEYWWMLVSMFIGLLMIFSFGILQLNLVYLHNWKNSFQAGFLIFSWWDSVKLFSAAAIAHYYFKNVKNT
jgi:biotin transport system substrate-specific component